MMPKNIYDYEARKAIAVMTRMMDVELVFMAQQKKEGSFHLTDGTNRDVRLVVGSEKGSYELVVRPAKVFGNMVETDLLTVALQQFDSSQQVALQAALPILSSMAIQAENTHVATVIKMIEPECKTLQQSKVMRNFALQQARHFVSGPDFPPRPRL